MRSTIVILAAGAAALALAGCQKKDAAGASQASAAASAAPATGASPLASLPHRKAGLWQMHQSVSGIDRVMTSEICIDDATEAKMSMWSAGASQNCSTQNVSRGLDGSIKIASTCKMGSGGTISTVATVSGDYSSHYRVHADSTTTGAAVPQMNGQHTMIIDAQWTGPCPPGQVGGDMTLPGVGKVNMFKTMKP